MSSSVQTVTYATLKDSNMSKTKYGLDLKNRALQWP